MNKNYSCRKIFFQLIFLTILSNIQNLSLYAQSAKIDSLNNALKSAKEDTSKVNILYSLSREVINSDPEMHKEYLAQSYSLAVKLNYKKALGDNLFSLGVVELNEGNYEKALSLLDRSLKISALINYKSGIASSLNTMGNVYRMKGDFHTAIEHFQKSIVLRKETKEYVKLGGCYNNMGNAYRAMGDYDRALSSYYEARRLYEKYSDDIEKTNLLLLNIGTVYYDLMEYSKALSCYEQSLKGNPPKMLEGNAYGNIGNVYRIQKKYDKAEEFFLKSLKVHGEANNKDGVCAALMDLSNNYRDLNRLEEAIQYGFKALKAAEELGDKNKICSVNISIAIIYENQKEFRKALEYAERSAKQAKEIESKEWMIGSYEVLSSVYQEFKNYEKSLEYYKLLTALKDSMFSKQKAQSIAELETRFETDKKEKVIQLLTKDNELKEKSFKEQRIIGLSLLAGLALLFILSATLYNRYRFKQKANLLLENQKKEIEQKNTLITDSIDYAKTIQEAILPSGKVFGTFFPDSFVFYKPKAIVSGDFCWAGRHGNRIVCAAVDCTGHGVPGAFMSLLGNNILENAVKRNSTLDPASILGLLNEEVVSVLARGKEPSSVKNGMDISLITVDASARQLEYAGAHNPLYVIRKGEMIEIKADRMSIGFLDKDVPAKFTNHTMELKEGDMLYLFSDGFPDQIGGPHRKKFYYRPFKDLLLSIHTLQMHEQKKRLEEVFSAWKGEFEQTDDILVIGIRI